MAEYYVRSRGKILGPFDAERIKVMRQRGRISRSEEVSTDKQNWQPLSQIREFNPVEVTPPPGAPPAGGTDRSAATAGAGEAPQADAVKDSNNWHYHDGKKQQGPVAFKILQAMANGGTLSRESLVWREGLANWVAAGSIAGLFEAAAPAEATPSPPAELKPPISERPLLSERTPNRGFLLGFCRDVFTPDSLRQTNDSMISLGRYASLLGCLAGPGMLFYLSMKNHNPQWGLVAAAAFLALAALRSMAVRMCRSMDALIQNCPSRIDTYASLDCLAILWFGLAAVQAACVACGFLFWGGIDALSIAAAIAGHFLLVGLLTTCIGLDGKSLQIELAFGTDGLPGELGIGWMACLLKTSLRHAVLALGFGSLLAAAGLVAAILLYLGVADTSSAHEARGTQLALCSGALLAYSLLVPLIAYLASSLLLPALAAAQAILTRQWKR